MLERSDPVDHSRGHGSTSARHTQQRGQEPWTLEHEMVQVAMSGEGVIGRRHFLRTIGLGAAGLAAIGGRSR